MSENIPNNKNRCNKCNKKLSLMSIQTGKCRCGGIYCMGCFSAKEHSCTFNYLEQSQKNIEKNNPAVIPAKV